MFITSPRAPRLLEHARLQVQLRFGLILQVLLQFEVVPPPAQPLVVPPPAQPLVVPPPAHSEVESPFLFLTIRL